MKSNVSTVVCEHGRRCIKIENRILRLMNLSPIITDNIAELLVKIFDFTERRREILMRNITEVAMPDFVPRDLDVDEFSDLMMQAISEHVRSERLLLCESETVGQSSYHECQIGRDYRSNIRWHMKQLNSGIRIN